MTDPLVLDLAQVRMTDVAAVGGKSASLGEMISQLTARGVRVPGGFATTAHAYRIFLSQNGLDARIEKRLATLDAEDVKALAAAGSEIRGWMLAQPFSAEFEREIAARYKALTDGSSTDASFAVRSSATAEDLPDASFAGQ